MRNFLILAAFLTVPGLAHSYIGPGLGAGTIVVILAILASLLLALFALFWYPLKRLLKGRKDSDSDEDEEEADRGKDTGPPSSGTRR